MNRRRVEYPFCLTYNKIVADIRAARDKNGVYIPRERYAQDEAEKKVGRFMLKRIKCLEPFPSFIILSLKTLALQNLISGLRQLCVI